MPVRDLPAVPEHVAIIMDGNGRWAKQRKKPRFVGHRAGRKTVERIIQAAAEAGVSTLSLFAFSTENWTRPVAEVNLIMSLMQSSVIDEAERLKAEDIRLRVLGSHAQLPEKLVESLQWAEEITADCQRMQVVFAINYSGHWSLLETARNLARQVQNGELRAEEISDCDYRMARPMPDLPPVDLLIRSSGENRISNFFLYELAYAELYFTERLWPDFGAEDFQAALEDYARRDRRFGGLNVHDAKEEK